MPASKGQRTQASLFITSILFLGFYHSSRLRLGTSYFLLSFGVPSLLELLSSDSSTFHIFSAPYA